MQDWIGSHVVVKLAVSSLRILDIGQRVPGPHLAITPQLRRDRILAMIGELALAILNVVLPGAFVRVAGRSVSDLTYALLLAVDDVALVRVTVFRSDDALALQPSVLELALVLLACLMEVENAFASDLAVLEIARILIAVFEVKLAMAVLDALDELTRVA